VDSDKTGPSVFVNLLNIFCETWHPIVMFAHPKSKILMSNLYITIMKQFYAMRLKAFSAFATIALSLFAFSGFAQLTGVKTIGGSSPDYATVSAAVSALQSSGVGTGGVTFRIRQGTYTGQYTIGSVTGMGSSNPIRFAPDASNTAPVVLTGAGTSSSNMGIFNFNGASYVRFDSLQIRNTGTSYARGFEFNGMNNFITINYCDIQNPNHSSPTSSYNCGIYDNSGTSNMSQNITVSNCNITKVGYGFYVYGGSSSSQQVWTVTGNTVVSGYMGMYFYYCGGDFNYNTVRNDPSSTYPYPYGMYMYYAYNSNIIGNDIELSNGTYAYAMYLNYCRATSSSRKLIANNTVSTVNCGSTTYGFRVYYADYCDVIHNSVNHTGGSAYPLYLYQGTSVNFYNNCIVNKGSGYLYYQSGSQTSSHNNYYSPSSLSTSGSGGSNVTSVDPQYETDLDLHANATTGIYNSGMSITGVMNDIDNEVRCPGTGCPGTASAPDRGADEYYVPALDASLSAFPTAAFCAGTVPVTAYVKNRGTSTLTSLNVGWALSTNSGAYAAQTGVTLSGISLASGADTLISLGNITISTGNTYQVMAYTSSPNSSTDQKTSNDTNYSSTFAPALSGVYTVGSSSGRDFPNLDSAFNEFERIGVCGPVTIYVEPGTYTHQLNISNINGTSAVNRITVMPDTNATARVTLQHTATNYLLQDNAVVLLNEVDYVTFKNMTFKSLSTSYGRVVSFMGNPRHIVFDNDSILAPITTTTSTYMAVIYDESGSPTPEQIKFYDCEIIGGAYGAYIYGASSSSQSPGGYKFDNCKLLSFYYMGYYHYYTQNDTLMNSTIDNTGSSYCCGRGIYNYYSNYSAIINNQINMVGSSYAYGHYSYYCQNGLTHGNTVRINTSGYGYTSYYYYNYNTRITNNRYIANVSTYNYNYMYYCGSNSSSNRNLVANNMYSSLGNTGSSTSYSGLYVAYLNYTDFLHNSVYYKPNSGYGIYMISGTTTDVRNNIVYAPNTSSYAFYRSSGSGSYSTNNFYAPNGINANPSSAATWGVDPGFVAMDDLHCESPLMHNAASNYTSLVSTDIDDEVRCPGTGCPGNASAPDVGADEFWLPNYDIGMRSLENTNYCAGSQLVRARLKNYGVMSADTAEGGWALSTNGGAFVAQTGFNIYGMGLGAGRDTLINLGTTTFTSGNYYDIMTWATNGSDQRSSNDTVVVRVQVALGGVYTVGSGRDYADPQSALADMALKGVCAPTWLHLDDTTFTGNLSVDPIPGASAANYVVLMSNPANANKAVINGKVTFKGTNYFTMRKVRVENTATTVDFSGAQQNLTIDSCEIICTSTSSGTYAIYEYNSSTTDSLRITNNEISGGYYCMYLYGTSTGRTDREMNWLIEGNRFGGYYIYGLYMYYTADGIFRNNYIESPTNQYSYPYGMMSYYANNVTIEGNKFVIGGTSGGYGMMLYYQNYYNRLTTDTTRVFNNMITIRNGTTDYTKYGCYLYYPYNMKFEHNNIYINSSYSSAYALYSNYMYSSYIRNNIFANYPAGGSTWYHPGTYSGSVNDYNAFWTGNSSNSGSSMALGSNSMITNPRYRLRSPGDLRVNSLQLDSGALAGIGITTDYFGSPRDASFPDIGAHEFVPCLYDAAMNNVYTAYQQIPMSQAARVYMTGASVALDTITGLMLHADVDGSPYNAFVGTLPNDEDTTESIVHNFSRSGWHNVKGYVSMTQSDCDVENDTLNYQFYVSDSVYAYDDSTFDNSLGFNSPGTGEFGHIFEVLNTDELSSGSFYLRNPTQGANVRLLLYSVSGAGASKTFTVVDSTRTMVVGASGTGWYTLPFGCRGANLTPGNYLITIEQSNPVRMELAINSNAMRTLPIAPYSRWYRATGGTWTDFDNQPAVVNTCIMGLRANFGIPYVPNVLEDTTRFCNGASVWVKPNREYVGQIWSNSLFFDSIKVNTPGQYSVTVWDEINCIFMDTTQVIQNDPIVVAANVTNASCGNSDGKAIAAASGTLAPYSYSWSTGGSADSITGVAGGTYQLTVTDGFGCENVSDVDVLGVVPVLSDSFKFPTCNGDPDGHGIVTVVQGFAPYTYNWGTAGNTPTQSVNTGLAAGSYTVTVTGRDNCTSTVAVVVQDPPVLNSAGAATNPTACGVANGIATVNVTGGVPPYRYLWSNGQTTDQNIGLTSGSYDVTITDANGCVKTQAVALSDPNAPVLTPNNLHLDCSYDTTTVSVNVTGGTAPLSYQWNTNATTASLPGMRPGTYTVVVSDNANCVRQTTVVITAPTAVTMSLLNPTDNGENNVGYTARGAGGTPAYTYKWMPSNETDSVATQLPNGLNTLTITDANGCSFEFQIDVFSKYTGVSIYSDPSVYNVYPNPTRGMLNVELNLRSEQDVTVKLLDARGAEILNFERGSVLSDKVQIDMSVFSAGMYILETTIGGEALRSKVQFTR
jgi:hypothetical protein